MMLMANKAISDNRYCILSIKMTLYSKTPVHLWFLDKDLILPRIMSFSKISSLDMGLQCFTLLEKRRNHKYP